MNRRAFISFFLLLPTILIVQGQPIPSFKTSIQRVITNNALSYGVFGVSAAVILPDGTMTTAVFGIGKKGVPLTDSTLFYAGNSTEMYLSALTFLLQEEGLLNIDSKVSTYLADVKNVHPNVTIKHLLTHTSGVYNIFLNPALEKELSTLDLSMISPEIVLEKWLRFRNTAAPGTVLQYYNPTDYLLLGLIIERITQSPLQQELRARLWNPLQMHHTFWGGYESNSFTEAGGWFIASSKEIINYAEDPTTEAYLKASWGGSNLLTTPTDACIFVRALVKGQLLKPNAFAEMSAILPLQSATAYQVGIGLERLQIGKELAFGSAGGGYYFQGNGMLVFHHPKENFTIGIATNTYSEKSDKKASTNILFKIQKDILDKVHTYNYNTSYFKMNKN